jgi:Lysophospholipase L1 and related esterases|tara:strand:+ start:440 stop:1066 length:627 start_codon:yes stop_codon:yes gene_type:complete
MKLKFIKSLIFVFSINCVYALDEQRTLLIFGDSISAGYGMSKEKQWSVLLQEKFNKENLKIKVINSSISGETTGGGLVRLEGIINQYKPSYVLLELGGNDALRGYPPKKIYSNLVEMISISEISNANIFLMQIKIPPNYGSRYQKAFESIYPRVAETTSAILIPFMLEEVALNADLMLPDGIHPKESAQPLIADFIYLQLKPLLIESN